MRTVTTPGARVAYQRAGRGPAVLLVQGVGVVSEGWRPQIDGLTDTFELIAPDNRGIGGSEILDGTVSVESMAADALAVLDDAGVDRAHVVGHSLGGLVGQQIALTAPGRVTSLALLCTFLTGRQGARLTPATLWFGVRTRIGSRAMRRRAFLELVMPSDALRRSDPAALADRLASLFGHDLADQPPIVMQQLRAMSRYDATPRLGALAPIPTLVVSASNDRIALPRYGRELANAIPHARFVELPDAGHGVTIQEPAAINRLLREHFGQRDGTVVSSQVLR